MFFQRNYFEVVRAAPKKSVKVRYWDRAATKKTETNDPDYTVGLKLERDADGILYVTDLVRLQQSPLQVQNAIKNTATQDGFSVKIGIEQDPGQAGVSEADYLLRMLSGFNVKAYKATKDKVTRSLPVSSQAEAGNIKVVEAKWNEDFFRELENFPEGTHDDIVDAFSGAFNMFVENRYDLDSILTM
jgi:predicted phage terminase large subunit-like protein